ncbi:unnamed protein product [Caenorhabditis nigoni]
MRVCKRRRKATTAESVQLKTYTPALRFPTNTALHENWKIFHMGTGSIKRYSLTMTGKFFDLLDFHRMKLNKPPFVGKSFHTKKMQGLELWTVRSWKMQLIWTVSMMIQQGCDRISKMHYNFPTVLGTIGTVYLISSVEEYCSWTPKRTIEKINALLS